MINANKANSIVWKKNENNKSITVLTNLSSEVKTNTSLDFFSRIKIFSSIDEQTVKKTIPKIS